MRFMMVVMMIIIALPAYGGQLLKCQFEGVGIKQFQRASLADDFYSPDGERWQTLESDGFLQLRSAEIDPSYVTNPFTVYLYDKRSLRVRQISAAMRTSPMMADGRCELSQTP